MIQLRWSPEAANDLSAIFAYIATDNISAAERVTRKIYQTATSLRSQPRRGRPGRLEGTRELVLTGLPFIIAYHVLDNGVEISRILHGAQRWPARKVRRDVPESEDMPSETYALFDTTEGKFKAKLFATEAPKTVENFISLADGTKTGKPFFDGLIFHRVIPGFMIQGGCPEGSGRGGPGYKFADEFHPGLRHDRKGLLSMANSGPNTNGSQFFVTVSETNWLDNKHAIFGEVIEGYDIVDKISNLPKDSSDRPKTPVKINSVTIERS